MLISGFEGIDLHYTRKPSNEPMRGPSSTSLDKEKPNNHG